MNLRALEGLVDDVGILQHGWHGVQRRSEGYCVDDNARLLLLCARIIAAGELKAECLVRKEGEPQLVESLIQRSLAFIAHAWNPSEYRFRNFMSYERSWLDEIGSEDSNGRAAWALGEATSVLPPAQSAVAEELLKLAVEFVDEVESTRAIAYFILGICRSSLWSEHPNLREVAGRIVEKLLLRYRDCSEEDWNWFEDVVSYANYRVPEACLAIGAKTGNSEILQVGRESLDWLNRNQFSDEGIFTPVGSDRVWKRNERMPLYDQQPLEAAGAVDCNALAYEVFEDTQYRSFSEKAWLWFVGNNIAGVKVYDEESGSCFDGITRDGANKNQGAESQLSALTALLNMHS